MGPLPHQVPKLGHCPHCFSVCRVEECIMLRGEQAQLGDTHRQPCLDSWMFPGLMDVPLALASHVGRATWMNSHPQPFTRARECLRRQHPSSNNPRGHCQPTLALQPSIASPSPLPCTRHGRSQPCSASTCELQI